MDDRAQHQHEDERNVQDVPQREQALVSAELRDLLDRFVHAHQEDLAEDIRRYMRGDPIAARPPTAWTRAIRWSVRHPLALTILACMAVAAISLTSIFASVWWLDRRPDRITILEDDATPEKLIRAVNLIARSGSILHAWPPNPIAGVYQITFARMIDDEPAPSAQDPSILRFSNVKSTDVTDCILQIAFIFNESITMAIKMIRQTIVLTAIFESSNLLIEDGAAPIKIARP